MENIPIGQYQSHDPSKNFAIKICFWKVTAGSVIPFHKFHTSKTELKNEDSGMEMGELENNEDEREEIVIQWQEKLFSAQEFDFYSDPTNCTTALQQKYREDVEFTKRTKGERENKRVFTYIDSDSFSATEESASVTNDDAPNWLTQRMQAVNNYARSYNTAAGQMGLRNRRNIVFEEPTTAMKANHVATAPCKRMNVMADLGYTKEDGTVVRDERVLCRLSIDANGLIVIKPDLDTGETFSLETYTGSRQVYQYTLFDASKAMTKLDREQETNLYSELYTRHSRQRLAKVGTEFYPEPLPRDLFVYAFFEIVNARDFEYDRLYVKYLLDLPLGWYSSDSSSLNGTTHSCSMDSSRTAHFSFPMEFQLLYTKPEGEEDDFVTCPILYIQIFSLDSWNRNRVEGYGYYAIPDVAGSTQVRVNTWRPKGESVRADMTRFFIGGTPELQDLAYVRDPEGEEKLSKYFFKTVSTGSVELRLNTIFQAKVNEDNEETTRKTTRLKQSYKRHSGSSNAVDSLGKVLGAFHKARQRMLDARSTLPNASAT